MTTSSLAVYRVRHPLKMRQLQVIRTRLIAPKLLRVTLAGDDLQDFVSASFDDHVKVFFPEPGQARPTLPQAGPNGAVFAEGVPRPTARDYTPRRYDSVANELDIEFVLHGDGPAATWAAQAQPGQYLGVGGPRGSFVIPDAFDWHLLIGDASALPAIGRRLEELPEGKKAIVVAEVDDAAGEISFQSHAGVALHWVHSAGAGAADLLEQAVRGLTLPAGEGYVWAAGESAVIRAIRQHLVAERGIDKSRIRASSYWRHGAVAVHETHED
jgi:NADPH-dependent ferric siderophore reductase